MKNRSMLALYVVFAPFLASVCAPFSASANGLDRVSKLDHGLIAGIPKNAPTVLGIQGDDGIRPIAPGSLGDDSIRPVVPRNERIGNTDESIRPVTPGNQRIGTDDSIKPARSKPVTPSAKIRTQNDDGI